MKSYVIKYPVSAYFIMTFTVSWLGAFVLVAPKLFRSESISTLDGILMFPIMLIGPFVSGIILTRLTQQRKGITDLYLLAIRWKVPVKWFIYPLIIFPGSILLTLFVLGKFVSPVFIPQFFLLGLLFGIPAGFFEEIGWTGFAFRKLSTKYTTLVSSLILGLLWSLWHLPVIDFLGAARPHGSYLLFFFCSFAGILMAVRIIIAWIYSNTGSVLLAQFTHAISTGTLVVFGPVKITPGQEAFWYACYAATLWTVVLIFRLFRK